MGARLRGIAAETGRIVAAGSRLSPAGRTVGRAERVEAPVAGARMYGPEPVPVPDLSAGTEADETARTGTAGEFYAYHRAERGPFCTDRDIHAPVVPVFRDDRGELLEEPYAVAFITAAAPDAGVVARTSAEETGRIGPALRERAGRVLIVFAVLDRRADPPTRAAFAERFAAIRAPDPDRRRMARG